MASSSKPKEDKYRKIYERLFRDHYKRGLTEFVFHREELPKIAERVGVSIPKNLGDVVYAIRYRIEPTESILAATPEGYAWIIVGEGASVYRMKLVRELRLTPNLDLTARKIPDSTPQIIAANARSDEQAVLARIRYNRLIDLFLQMNAYSLQGHLRTAVKGLGQIEIDELYVGVDRRGIQYAVPIQVKGGKDRHSMVQTLQDVAFCQTRMSHLVCRPVSAQSVGDTIALFEIEIQADGAPRVCEERHYHLVPANQISAEEMERYRRRRMPDDD